MKPTSFPPSEALEASAKQAAHLGRIQERSERIAALTQLLAVKDRGTVFTALKEQGYKLEDGFENKALAGIREGINAAIGQMQNDNDEFPGLARAVRERLVPVAAGAPTPKKQEPSKKDTKDIELSPDVLESCLRRLEADFKRGIVLIDDEMKIDGYTTALKKDKTAGKTWEEVKGQLEKDEGALLKKAASMPGGAELIGVDAEGKLVMITRADKNGVREPVIFAQRGDEKLVIAGDIPDRDSTMKNLVDGGVQLADYWEIRDAVLGMGFELPRDPEEYVKKGLVAAAEAVTKGYFVGGGSEWRSTITDCGDVSRSSNVRVVDFYPYRSNPNTYVYDDYPSGRHSVRGAVLVLRG